MIAHANFGRVFPPGIGVPLLHRDGSKRLEVTLCPEPGFASWIAFRRATTNVGASPCGQHSYWCVLPHRRIEHGSNVGARQDPDRTVGVIGRPSDTIYIDPLGHIERGANRGDLTMKMMPSFEAKYVRPFISSIIISRYTARQR